MAKSLEERYEQALDTIDELLIDLVEWQELAETLTVENRRFAQALKVMDKALNISYQAAWEWYEACVLAETELKLNEKQERYEKLLDKYSELLKKTKNIDT